MVCLISNKRGCMKNTTKNKSYWLILICFLVVILPQKSFSKTLSNQTTRPYCLTSKRECLKLYKHFKNSSKKEMVFSPRCEVASPAIVENFCSPSTKWVLWLRLTVSLPTN